MFLDTGTLSSSVLHHLNSSQHGFGHTMPASSLSNNFQAQGRDFSQEALVGDILL